MAKVYTLFSTTPTTLYTALIKSIYSKNYFYHIFASDCFNFVDNTDNFSCSNLFTAVRGKIFMHHDFYPVLLAKTMHSWKTMHRYDTWLCWTNNCLGIHHRFAHDLQEWFPSDTVGDDNQWVLRAQLYQSTNLLELKCILTIWHLKYARGIIDWTVVSIWRHNRKRCPVCMPIKDNDIIGTLKVT